MTPDELLFPFDDDLPRVINVDWRWPHPMKVYEPKARKDGVFTLRFLYRITPFEYARARGIENLLDKYPSGDSRRRWMIRQAKRTCMRLEWIYDEHAVNGRKLEEMDESYQALVELDAVCRR